MQPRDLVLDIGAGTGAITRRLLGAGATVIAVELHPARAALLRDQFAADRCTVVQVDATDLRLPRRPFAVVANPPFASITAVLRRLTAPGSRLTRADLIVPAYVARRWASYDAPGAGRWSHTFAVEVVRPLPRSAFRPPATAPTAHLAVLRRGRGSARP
ncbi:MAG: rRNA (adenine-N6)-dimethyltransferase [Frankiaceae bacterium]|nr:rRNA (adenine-N6)-dimethyltransferase [Frankiaceae bacterium]